MINEKIFLNKPSEKALAEAIPALKEKRLGNFLTVVFTLLASICFGLFAVNPTFGTIADLQRQVTDQQDILAKLNTKIAVLLALQKSYNTLQSDLPLTTAAVPTTPETGQLLGLLQGLANQDTTPISHIQLFPVDVVQNSGDKPLSFAFTLDVDGTYQNVLAFGRDITQLPRVVTIDTVSLATSNNIYRLNIKGKAYFQKSYETK